MASSSFYLLLSVMSAMAPFLNCAGAESTPLAHGLSWSFYEKTCPKVESIIGKLLKKTFKEDIGQAAALLRLHFHDCFVQGCDGSVLLDGSANGPSEQDAPPNLTLRKEAFEIIENLRAHVHQKCGRTVSCADILAIAARDAIVLSGGPYYEVPLGRRDGLTFATRNATLANIPSPTSNASVILAALTAKRFDLTDTVALSGGHTIGISHCTSFTGRLYPTQDPTMDNTFANKLKIICPVSTTDNTTVLDVGSPNTFDNSYFVNLKNGKGLFVSDQDLYTYRPTRSTVKRFAADEEEFFEAFKTAMVKMGQLSILTGIQGEIRSTCSARNADTPHVLLSPADEALDEGLSEL